MLIIPAIDLYQGKVVRFIRGNPSRSKVYSETPLEVAKRWEAEGAKLLHIVDLSAALGQGDNFQIIKKILKEVEVKVEVGGGIRNFKKAKELVSQGAERIIIGTKGLDEDFLDKLMQIVSKERIAVGVDVIDSYLAIEGWQRKTDFNGLDFIAYLKLKGIKWVIYTNIARDGTLAGIDYREIEKLSLYKDMNIIISGGIASLEDLRTIKESAPFLRGVIVGKALYEEKFSLSEALNLK